MKKPVALCLVMLGAVFACMCVCSGLAAVAGDDHSSWDESNSDASFDIKAPIGGPDAPAQPTRPIYFNDHNQNDNTWVKLWGIFSTLTLIMIVGGIVAMAFNSSRKMPPLQRPKRQTII